MLSVLFILFFSSMCGWKKRKWAKPKGNLKKGYKYIRMNI